MIFTSGTSEMRLATLVTNTDFSAFALQRPLDDQKFATMIAEVRPDWDVTAFWVCKDEFPSHDFTCDGVMITGSPASVTEDQPWMLRLQAMIRDLVNRGVPLFGACFGHQIIAKALGAPIIRNPEGWAHGRIEIERVAKTPWSGEAPRFSLYGSHIEQVGALPGGTTRLFSSPGCPIAGFGLGNRVFTVQHHPEMTFDFIADLTEEYADYLGESVTLKARHSIGSNTVQRQAFASEIAAFFEQAEG